jgi:hypothetical protein
MRRIVSNINFIPVLICACVLFLNQHALTEKAIAEQKQISPIATKILRDLNIDPQDNSVSIGKDRVIGPDEVVVNDVVVVGANLTVNGKVHGDAVCIGGNLKVGPNAEINGELVSIGGQLTVDPSAKTNGSNVNIMGGSPFNPQSNPQTPGIGPNGPNGPNIPNIPQYGPNWFGVNKYDEQPTFASKILRLALDAIYLGFLLFFALILTVFMPKQFNHIEEHLSNEFPRCTLLGIALMIGFPLILLAFVITLVGILAIPLLLLAWVLSCLLGYIAFGRILGRRIIAEKPVMLQILVGLVLLHSPLLIGDFVLLADGNFFTVIGLVFRIIGYIILFSVNFIGFGAVVYSLWGKRDLLRSKKNKQNGSTGPSENGDAVAV